MSVIGSPQLPYATCAARIILYTAAAKYIWDFSAIGIENATYGTGW